jgi:hypothetical protein
LQDGSEYVYPNSDVVDREIVWSYNNIKFYSFPVDVPDRIVFNESNPVVSIEAYFCDHNNKVINLDDFINSQFRIQSNTSDLVIKKRVIMGGVSGEPVDWNK